MTGWKWSAPLNRLGSLLLLVVLVSAASLKPATADEFEKNIVTGGAKGTYIQIGKDLAEVEAQCGLTLNVRESAGSLENLVAVKNRLFTQFGIVQSDVLDYVRSYSANDPELSRSLWGVRIMFPVEANAVFAEIPPRLQAALREKGWRFYTFIGEGGCRLMCAWDTAPETVDRFASDLEDAAAKLAA